MQDVISVIVPVYNVADYLPQCLDSILSQDHEKLEVILVDDGSKDASGKICDEYAQKDSRIRVIHQCNGGGAAAKNAGLRVATGEYLSFVDSDDYLEPKVYGYLLGLMKEYDADAVVGAYQNLYRDGVEPAPWKPGREVLEGYEYLRRFTTDWTAAILWNKLYRREIFQGVFFEEGHKIDDEYFTYQGFLSPRRVVCDDRILYNYRRRASSIMLSPSAHTQRAIDRVDAYCKRRETVAEKCPELKRDFEVQYLDALGYMTEYPDNTAESQNFLKAKLREYMRQRGNSIAPKCLWRSLLRLYMIPTNTLLRKYHREPKTNDSQRFFS